jgi:sulfotransferase family protein
MMELEQSTESPRAPVSGGERLPVLMIGGLGRSGSTVLDRMLGQVPGFCSVGELVHVWLRGLKEDTLCACQKHFSDCDFWQSVGRDAFGGWERLDPDRMVEWHKSVDRHRYIPQMLAPRLTPGYNRRLQSFSKALEHLYAALSATSGARMIVDSSKHASYAFLLRHVSNVDLRVVHLVRDPRGVAYSWTKRVVRPEITTGKVYMAVYDPAHMATRWMSHNLLFELLSSTGVPVLRVRYEDLARDPRGWLRRILAFAGHPPTDQELRFLTEEAAVPSRCVWTRHGRSAWTRAISRWSPRSPGP